MNHSLRLLLSGLALCGICILPAQQEETRAGQIQKAREERAKSLQPQKPTKEERWLSQVECFALGEGSCFIPVRPANLIETAGFGLAAQYRNASLLKGRLLLRASASGTVRGWYRGEFEASLPSLNEGRIFLTTLTSFSNYSSVPYYGSGPDSEKSDRTNFRIEGPAVQLRLGFRPLRRFSFGLLGGYQAINVGPGTRTQFISSELKFPNAPGIQRQTDFLESGAFAAFDTRDAPRYALRGSLLSGEYTLFSDRGLGRHTFNRFDFEAQHYIPFRVDKNVIALRARSSFTRAHLGNEVPFYLQPTLGSSRELRGYRQFRFYGDNSLSMQAEYRWQLISLMDMALFADAGKVFNKVSQWNVHNLESSVGFGARLKFRGSVFMRADVGFSHEGFQLWIRFNDAF